MVSRLFRPHKDRIVGGVCSGLGLYFGLDPVIVRLLFVVIAATTGFTLILYPLMWVIMPSEQPIKLPPDARFDPQTGQPLAPPPTFITETTELAESHGTQRAPGTRNRVLALVLVGVGLLILLDNLGKLIGFNVSGLLLPLLLVGLGVYLLQGNREQRG